MCPKANFFDSSKKSNFVRLKKKSNFVGFYQIYRKYTNIYNTIKGAKKIVDLCNKIKLFRKTIKPTKISDLLLLLFAYLLTKS